MLVYHPALFSPPTCCLFPLSYLWMTILYNTINLTNFIFSTLLLCLTLRRINSYHIIANSIILQLKVESLVVSILLEESANLGIVEEHLEVLHSILKPFCSFES